MLDATEPASGYEILNQNSTFPLAFLLQVADHVREVFLNAFGALVRLDLADDRIRLADTDRRVVSAAESIDLTARKYKNSGPVSDILRRERIDIEAVEKALTAENSLAYLGRSRSS